ncbi:hypothetical protein [Streptomyces sp. NBC_00005]|uniref:hypothetical protein n=1 Tax=Streptomyces sp. NBC_00005 TaxID=2903609 RepID=UPI00324D2B63
MAEASAQDPVTAGLHPGEGRPGGHRQTSTPQTDRDASADTQADTLADPEAGTAGGQDGSSRAISLLTSLVSQTAVLTALVFYFGWVSTRASFRYFHVDTSLLEFSLVDYMVRGVRLAYPSLLALGLVTFFCVYAHHLVLQHAATAPELVRQWGRGLGLTGIVAVCLGLAVVAALDSGSETEPPWGPLLMVVGFAAIAYGHSLGPQQSPVHGQLWRDTAIVLALLSLFATAASYAEILGRRTAEITLSELHDEPDVVIYSKEDIFPERTPGIKVVELARQKVAGDDAEPLYRYRITGLKMLIRSGSRCFLIPKDWRPKEGSVIILPSDASDLELRMEFRAPAR